MSRREAGAALRRAIAEINKQIDAAVDTARTTGLSRATILRTLKGLRTTPPPSAEELAREAEKRRLAQKHLDSLRPEIRLRQEAYEVGLKVLAKKYHPDIGGDHETMTKINAMRDQIIQIKRRSRT